MKARLYYLTALTVSVIWLFFTGCYSFIGQYGPPFYDGDDQHYFEKLIYDSRTQLDETFTYKLAQNDELRVIDADPSEKSQALNAPLLLRFVWFSDVQLRQREVKLFSDRISHDLDNIIPSFEHNFVQEDFDWAVYLSQIEATNRLHRDRPLDFMIHTGDAIDSGTIEEIYQFIYISDQLQIPWLNIIGNHDIALFGNYQERLGYTRQASVNFFPVGNLTNFVWMHRKERLISGFGRHLLPTPSEGGHSPSEDIWIGKKLPPTNHHGFDLASDRICSDFPSKRLDYDHVTGYYAANLCETRIPMRLIVMNSAKTDEWGADGQIKPFQRTWLQNVLLPADGGINLVFVHHRPKDFDAETQALLNSSDHGPLVMFTGHTHQHHLEKHSLPNGRSYYELNTGAVLEFPQIGRLIELRGTEEGKIWVVSRALWSSPMTVKEMPAGFEIEAILKECVDQRDNKRKIFTEAVRCGHYGAYDDYLSDRKKVWGRPQPFSEAWESANVIIPIR